MCDACSECDLQGGVPALLCGRTYKTQGPPACAMLLSSVFCKAACLRFCADAQVACNVYGAMHL